MKSTQLLTSLANQIEELKEVGLFKAERIITSAQQAVIQLADGRQVINFCANNYLGLANHPQIIAAAQAALNDHGFGMASVRFICGTQDLHKELEQHLSHFLGMEDTILYSSCFDANGGLFETILGEEDAIISDALNHASIIDGVRLCKARRFRYQNNDMQDLEQQLKAAQNCRYRLIATDGVFSMDGIVANLKAICDLADRYDALVMVDDSHAVGFMGKTGRGTHEYCGVMNRVHLITGTLGKALGGASGGYTSGRKEIIAWLRQRSRPYLFSNSLAPMISAASLKVLELLEGSDHLRTKLHENSAYFRRGLSELGFTLVPGEHPIIPVMLGDAKLATEMANQLLAEGIYVIGFSYPVVPKGQARIRTQLSAAHERTHLDRALTAFAKVGYELGSVAKMRSLSKLQAAPGLWLTEVPVPTVGPNDVLIKIKKTAICGTDLHIYNWDEWAQRTVPVPLIIGHEFVGVIAEIGGEVTGFKRGDRVSGEGHLTCGHCRNCRAGRRHLCRNTIGIGCRRNGCFADYLALPADNAFHVPDVISDDVASFLDPLGNAVHTALSFDMVGEDVLITGAGPIGIMAVSIARHIGARNIVITDINDYRLALARKMGATCALNTQHENLEGAMRDLKMTEGFDVGLEMSGHPQAFNQMLKNMNHGGHIALLGILPNQTAIDWDQVIFKGLILKGIYGREMFETWYKMTSLLQTGLDVTPLITHCFPVTEFQQAFDILHSGQAAKVILDWK